MRQSSLRLILAVCMAFALFACGQQGPLYLPDEPPPMPNSSICPTCAQAPVAEEAPSAKEEIAGDEEAGGEESTDSEDEEEAASETLESYPEPISDENNE